MPELYNIDGVEIFATGTHKKDKYTTEHLDMMIKAYTKVGFTPPLKDGHHNEKQGWPALGWIKNLRRVGEKLVADFIEMPKQVYEAIKNRRYDRVSAEIYFDYEDKNLGFFPRVLRAVALLGAEIPEVKNLKPLREVVHEDGENKWRYYDDENEVENIIKEYAVDGVKFVIGRLKGKTTTTVQAVLFDRATWSVSKAKAWLSEKEMRSDKMDDTGETLRFRQRDPADFESDFFRTIIPGRAKENKDNNDEGDNDMSDERLKKLEEKLDAIVDEKNKAISEKDEAITSLGDEVKKLSEKLATAESNLADATKGDDSKRIMQLQKELEEKQKNLNSQIEKFGETEKKNQELIEQARQERIQNKSGDLKFPALRPYVKVFYDLVTQGGNETRVVKFSADAKESTEMSLESIADGLVTTLNKLADNKLFGETSTIPEFNRDDKPADENPRVEVDKRVKEYCVKNNLDPVEDYNKARDLIFLEDPALMKAYATS